MNLAGTKAVVTGGAGFIGSELVRQLAAGGAKITVLDNLATGSAENLDGVDARFVRGDVRHAEAVRAAFSETVDVLFHLACLGVRHSIGNPVENHEVNGTGTLRVLEAAREADVRRVVHVSTSEVYGDAQCAPMSEDHPALPKTVYGASKLAGENYARAFFHTHGLPVSVVRPFNSFGPRSHAAGEAGEVIPRFLRRLRRGDSLPVFGDGSQTRDFTFVSDTARGILLAGFSAQAVGRTIHFGTGREVSILALGRALADALGLPAPVFRHFAARPGDVRRLIADSSLARSILGWEPLVSFGDGLRATADWFEKNPGAENSGADEPAQNWCASVPCIEAANA
jgi:UDP-glucose 4-epimerase